MARIRRATPVKTSLTFRAVTLPLRTSTCRPFGLDTALTSSPAPFLPGRTLGVPGEGAVEAPPACQTDPPPTLVHRGGIERPGRGVGQATAHAQPDFPARFQPA